MFVTGEIVHAFNRAEIPKEDETIADDLDLDMLVPYIHDVSYYFRTAQECPLARGNWMLDIRMKDGAMVSYKYPKEMKEAHFLKFIKPLLIKMHN